MQQFMIELPHSEAECLQMLDEGAAMGSEALSKWRWGCMAGDHTGYAMIEAGSEAEARETIPALVRSKAKVVPVQAVTEEQIKAFHSMH
jgi:hypothetical protein